MEVNRNINPLVFIDPATGGPGCDTCATTTPNTRLVQWRASIKLNDILDGTSNTFMVGEKHIRLVTRRGTSGEDRSVFNGDSETGPAGREAGYQVDAAGNKIAGTDRPIAPSPTYNVTPSEIFGSYHPGICQFVMVDGSVKPLRTTTSLDILYRLTNRKDGKPVESP